jgi:hypothetical protein
MSSIWTNLLFLHGHVVPKDLLWRLNDGVDPRKIDTSSERTKAAQASTAPSCKPCDSGKPACA